MSALAKYDEYLEALLAAQYGVSDILEHRLSIGEAREEFLREHIQKQFTGLMVSKGAVVYHSYQSPQQDIIITRFDARRRDIGGQLVANLEDVKFLIEVKSCAKTSELKSLNELAEEIKGLHPSHQPKVGLFCYNYQIQKKNLLRNFGYVYDVDLDGYLFKKSLAPKYPHIDFVQALDVTEEGKDFFIIKDIISGGFILLSDEPTSKHFFRMFEEQV